MCSIEKILESKDIDFIVKARNAAERKVNRNINILKKLLVRDKNGNFVTTLDNEDKIKSTYFHMKLYYENFSSLHLEYSLRKQLEIDPYFEQELIILDEDFKNDVLAEYENITKIYREYKRNASETEIVFRSEDMTKLSTEIKVLESSFKKKYSFAESVYTSTDNSFKKMASLAKEELEEAIEKYLPKMWEYNSARLQFGYRFKFERLACSADLIKADTLVYLLETDTAESEIEASHQVLKPVDHEMKIQTAEEVVNDASKKL